MVVRRDHRGARVVVDVGNLRIDEQRDRLLPRGLDGRVHHPLRHAPFQIIRDDDGGCVAAVGPDGADDAVFDLAGDLRVVLIVHACDLLVPLGDDADLGRRHALGIGGDEPGFNAGLAAPLQQRLRVVVLPRHRDERRVAAKGGDVVRHVRRAADAVCLVIEGDDGHRRLRGDARHSADDERVEHRVADDEHVRGGEGGNEAGRAIRRERRQLHVRRVPPRTAA